MEKFVEPRCLKNYFTCPHCKYHNRMTWELDGSIDRSERITKIETIFSASCCHCGKKSIWLWDKESDEKFSKYLDNINMDNKEKNLTHLSFYFNKETEETLVAAGGAIRSSQRQFLKDKTSINFKLIYPEICIEPNSNMPKDVKTIFVEASSILNNSPRASAALLRLALEKLLTHLNKKSKGNNLFNAINKYIDDENLEPTLKKICHLLRINGNDNIHESNEIEESVSLRLTRDSFDMFNFFVDEAITRKKRAEEFASKYKEEIPKQKRSCLE